MQTNETQRAAKVRQNLAALGASVEQRAAGWRVSKGSSVVFVSDLLDIRSDDLRRLAGPGTRRLRRTD